MKTTSATVLVLAGLIAGGAFAAELPPYGHPDFVPTPDRPLGYRGDGNGWFPGATPVLEFYEGTPTRAERAFYDNQGKEKKNSTWDYADSRTKNILWKTSLPGWSDAQPIPVKGRVFALCEPYFLVCVDAATGKTFWANQEPTVHVHSQGMSADILAEHPGHNQAEGGVGY